MIERSQAWALLGGTGRYPEGFGGLFEELDEHVTLGTSLETLIADLNVPADQFGLGLSNETLIVCLRALVQLTRDHPDASRESQGSEHALGVDYAGRLVLELVQNAHDAIAWSANSNMVIGRFGVGMKALAAYVDRVRLVSGPWQLVWGAQALRDVIHSEFPLFTYPLPDRTDWEPPAGVQGRVVAMRMERRNKRPWLTIEHAGQLFDAHDVQGMIRRHKTGKDRVPGPAPGGARLEFRLLPSAESRVRSQLHSLTGEDLLFLPHVDEVQIDIEGTSKSVTCTLEHECEGLRVLVGTGGARWTVFSSDEGTQIAVPHQRLQEGRPLFKFFRVSSTAATATSPVIFHCPDLILDLTRERLSDAEDDRVENALALERAVCAFRRMIELLAQESYAELSSSRAPLSAFPQLLGSGDPISASRHSVEARAAKNLIEGRLVHLISEGTLPVVAAATSSGTRLRRPTEVRLPVGSSAAAVAALCDQGTQIFGDELVFPTPPAAHWLVQQADQSVSRTSEPECARAIRRLFSNAQAIGGALFVAGAAAAAAASAGAWLARQFATVTLFPVPLDSDREVSTEVRLPGSDEPAETRALFLALGWASVDIDLYGDEFPRVRALLESAGAVPARLSRVVRVLYERPPDPMSAAVVARLISSLLVDVITSLPETVVPFVKHFKGYLVGDGDGYWADSAFLGIHLSRLQLPAADGQIRPASELGLGQDLPASLRLDVERLAEWVGPAAGKKLAQACSVWEDVPLTVLIARPLEPMDTVFKRGLHLAASRWPARWTSHVAIDLSGRVKSDRRWASRRKSQFVWLADGTVDGPQLGDLFDRAGAYRGDELFWFVDVPEALCEGEVVAERWASRVAAVLGAHDQLRWSYFACYSEFRYGQTQRRDLRFSAPGQFPSAALMRLRHTSWLPPHEDSSHAGLLCPASATGWEGKRLRESPARHLQVSSESSDVLNTMLVAHALEGRVRTGHPVDPRWVIARLLELSGALDSDRLILHQRLLSHLVDASPSVSLRPPSPGRTWRDVFSTLATGSAWRSIAEWMLDAGQSGFADLPLPRTEWRVDSAWVRMIPVPVDRGSGPEAVRIGELEAPIYRHGANEAELSALESQFAVVLFPERIGLALSQLLGVPWFLPLDASITTNPVAGDLAAEATTRLLAQLRVPILSILSSAANVAPDTLKERWPEDQELLVEAHPRGTHSVRLRGFQGKSGLLAVDSEAQLFRVRSKGRPPVLTIQAGCSVNEIESALDRLAEPLASSLGLEGEAPRTAVEALLLKAQLGSMLVNPGSGLPVEVSTYLARRRVAEDPDVVRGLAQAVLDRLSGVLTVLGADVQALCLDTRREWSSRDVPILVSRELERAVGGGFLAPRIQMRAVRASGYIGLSEILFALRECDPDAVDPELECASIPELVGGEDKRELLARWIRPIRPWWFAYPGDHEIPAHDTGSLDRFLGDAPDFRRALAAEFELAGGALGAPSVHALETGDQIGLEQLFKAAGVAPPGEAESRRAQWNELVESLLGRVRALASLVVLMGELGGDDDAARFGEDIGRFRERVRVALEVALGHVGWPPISLRVFVTLVAGGIATEGLPGPGSVDVESLQLWCLTAAESVAPGLVDDLVAQTRRTILVAGRRFVGQKDAADFFERHRAQLPAPQYTSLSGGRGGKVNPKPAKGKSARQGRRRFTARSGVIGREGELYVRGLLEGAGARIFDVSTARRAQDCVRRLEEIAGGTGPLSGWASAFAEAAAASAHPGFDLLAVYLKGVEVEAVGVEVKATDRDVDELDSQWTENEFRAAIAADAGEPWPWPVGIYRLVAVTRLWMLDGEDYAVPRVISRDNPIRLGKRLRLETFKRVTYRARIELD